MRSTSVWHNHAHHYYLFRSTQRPLFSFNEILNLSKIDRWFLVQIQEVVDLEEELSEANS